jgi:glycosyltransferase involved in cell wall biosynthesis
MQRTKDASMDKAGNSIPRTLIIVPAFNESSSIVSVLESLAVTNPLWDIVVINDRSSDNTGDLARSTGKARVIDLSCNLGIGAAVQTGFKIAHEYFYDFAVQFDGDGQHKAGEICLLIDSLKRNEADVVIGSRFCKRSDSFRSTWARRIGINLLSLLTYLLTGKKISDITSGFRAYNREAIGLLSEEYPSDYPEPEAIVLLSKHGIRIKEIAVTMQERQGGKSSIMGIKIVWYMIKVMPAIIIAGMRGTGR